MNLHDIIEEGGTVALSLDLDYPVEELKQIVQNLTDATYLVPGFIPAEAGFLNLQTLILDQFSDEIETYILPDRNVVTRIATIAESGARTNDNGPQLLAANLMALAQIVDWQIDPSISFHELAHRTDNGNAAKELSWFRAANEAQAWAWIDIALGRASVLGDLSPAETENMDLAKPLNRWQNNYAICLKMAELELSVLSRFERVKILLEWMDSEFHFGGPAAMFAIFYYGPSSKSSGMLKGLRSQNRARAIAGIKNAAWDISYLCEFTNKAKFSNFPQQQYVLATADKSLAEVAQLLFLRLDGCSPVDEFALAFAQWWPENQAKHIAVSLVLGHENAAKRNSSNTPPKSVGRLTKTINDGENFILTWQP